MKRNRLTPHVTAVGHALAAAILAGVLFAGTPAAAGIDVQINIGNAPPPPRLIFQARPHERYFPGQRVYIVDDPRVGDYDCFRYGGYYWVFRDGYWYRAPSWRSRFVVVNPRYVPTVFYQVPAQHWKHRPSGPPQFMRERGSRPPGMDRTRDAGPPGQAKKGGNPPGNSGDDHGKGNRGRK